MSSGGGAGAGVTFLGTGAGVNKSDSDHRRICGLGCDLSAVRFSDWERLARIAN